MLPVVMPYMREGLASSDTAMRQGVCLGLSEILTAATRRQVEVYIELLVQALQQALCDTNESVRTQAAKAFLTLFKAIGTDAIEEVSFDEHELIDLSPVADILC